MKDSPSLSALLGLGGATRTLVVEDERAIREGLSFSLTALGHEVDAREGVERTDLPLVGHGLAILDNYFLSKTLTGVALTPALRRANPTMWIVAISSDAEKNAEMVRLGADLAVTKSALRRRLG